MMVDRHRLVRRGHILALTGLHHRPGCALVHAGDCMGLILVMMLIVA
jgi:hypothetical protein